MNHLETLGLNNKSSMHLEEFLEEEKSLAQVSYPQLEQLLYKKSADEICLALNLMAPSQRQYLWDQSSWVKDDFCLAQFKFWPVIIASSINDEVLFQFIQSDNFLVYLKSAFTISLIDVENPLYPEHDDYFVTDDGQYVFEYNSEDDVIIKETQLLLKQFYNHYGVNKAYYILHSLVEEHYLGFLETKYQESLIRLEKVGLPSYIKSLEINSTFFTIESIHAFTKKISQRKIYKEKDEPDYLSFEATIPPKICWSILAETSLKLEDLSDWACVNLNQLINGIIGLEKSNSASFVSFHSPSKLRNIAKKIQSCLSLGLSWIDEYNISHDRFSFQELYKIGHSLFTIKQSKLNKIISEFGPMNKFNDFCGEFWDEFVEKSLESIPHLKKDTSFDSPAISNIHDLSQWDHYMHLLEEQIPLMKQFKENIDRLSKEGVIHDSFYSTIKIHEMDFQVILLSTFINLTLGHYEKDLLGEKLGVSLEDLEKFKNLNNHSWDDLLCWLNLSGEHKKIFDIFLANIDENSVILYSQGH